jgi:hypothetical protein
MVPSETVKRNLKSVLRRIASAAERSGRAPEDVRLIAVTKTVGTDEIQALYDFGVRDFGESRIPAAQAKMEALAALDIRWHMIGRLQTNKARKAVGKFNLIHSLDSVRLGDALDRAAQVQSLTVDTLLEVNLGAEETKTGFDPNILPSAIEELRRFERLHLVGLMTMAPMTDDPETVRSLFRQLRKLRDDLAATSAGASVRHLSMGMTQDYEVAIEEGADMVRVGTALFRT